MTTYEPYGTWPPHGNKEWNRTQDAAKDRGWTLETRSNHSTRWLYCPAEECKLGPIYSSAQGTEDVARDFYDDVLACPHGAEDQRNHVMRAKEHIETGERYARAARKQLEASAKHDEVRDLWEIADQQAGEAGEALRARDDQIINDIQVGEWAAEELGQEAQQGLAGTPLAGEHSPGPVLAGAEDAAANAADVIEQDVARGNTERPALEARLDDLRSDLDDLYLQVDGRAADT